MKNKNKPTHPDNDEKKKDKKHEDKPTANIHDFNPAQFTTDDDIVKIKKEKERKKKKENDKDSTDEHAY